MGGSVTTLIVLALVFVFVALRLWSVLGRRTGHEQTLVKPESVPTVRGVSLKAPNTAMVPALGQEPTPSASATSGLRAIAAADSQFDVARFVEGAKAAYGMVLEAYWKGDQDSLDKMVDPEVRTASRMRSTSVRKRARRSTIASFRSSRPRSRMPASTMAWRISASGSMRTLRR